MKTPKLFNMIFVGLCICMIIAAAVGRVEPIPLAQTPATSKLIPKQDDTTAASDIASHTADAVTSEATAPTISEHTVSSQPSADTPPGSSAAVSSQASAQASAEASAATSAAEYTGMVSLNSGTLEELCSLDGIGEVYAARIIAYRNEHGGFRSIEEITKIKGIGEKRFATIKPRLTL